jgi:hypothetical protein
MFSIVIAPEPETVVGISNILAGGVDPVYACLLSALLEPLPVIVKGAFATIMGGERTS